MNSDHLAFRELPEIVSRLDIHGDALDHGCGTGRSTRFLQTLGLRVVGVDIEASMLARARKEDPSGKYRQVAVGALPFADASFDLVFSSYVIIEMSTRPALEAFISEGVRVLKPGGHMIVVTNTPEFYGGRWVSCDVDFPENRAPLHSGQRVRVRLMPEEVELADTFWSDADYRDVFARTGLAWLEEHRPLGLSNDGIVWRDEAHTAPYVVYVLAAARPASSIL